jgi:hypothetical protein
MTTVIYLTDNKLDERIATLCRDNIQASIGDRPLISVSHKPLDFGHNICVGEKERSSLMINIQMLLALAMVETKYIAIAEHDCLYTTEHFDFIPPDDSISWYNENVWLLQLHSETHPEYDGLFSMFPERKANSQLICETELMKATTKARIEIMSDENWKRRYPGGRVGEAGHMDYHHAMRLSQGKSLRNARKLLQSYIADFKGENFRTIKPNIDIRHQDNFTKNRRGKKRTYELPYWGKVGDVITWN